MQNLIGALNVSGFILSEYDFVDHEFDILRADFRDLFRVSAASDRIQEQYVDTIREETPYTTPSGETIKLPSFYDQVYTNGNGTYILNSDALYNPNTDSTVNNVNWDRIEAQR